MLSPFLSQTRIYTPHFPLIIYFLKLNKFNILKIEFLHQMFDFIYPKTSVISDEWLGENNSNEFISESEEQSLRKVTPDDLKNLEEKLTSDHSFSYLAFYENEDFSKIVYNLKYRGMKKLGIYLGEIAGRELLKHIAEKDIRKFDMIIPVPLHKAKLRERGYNQSECIAKGIGKVISLNVRTDILNRIRNTTSQTKLNKEGRFKNIKDAFIINEKTINEIKDSRIIIVDDVVTTGSTLNEAIRTIRQSTNAEILGCTVAMARD